MSNFDFLAEWPALHSMAALAEGYVRRDPRTASFHARRTLEGLTAWQFEHDPEFVPRPYDTALNAMLRSEAYTRLVPANVRTHADLCAARAMRRCIPPARITDCP